MKLTSINKKYLQTVQTILCLLVVFKVLIIIILFELYSEVKYFCAHLIKNLSTVLL